MLRDVVSCLVGKGIHVSRGKALYSYVRKAPEGNSMVFRLATGNQRRRKQWRLGWEAGLTAG